MTDRRVGLFVTCLVDLVRPRIGWATVDLLRRAGFEVVVPPQGCCGQVNVNAGDREGARMMALAAIEAFAGIEWVVAPSGSCASTIRNVYPELFTSGTQDHAAARDLAARTWELTAFLAAHGAIDPAGVTFDGSITYHDSCSGLRELGIKRQPRELLARVRGLTLVEMTDPEQCCGFGGAFCVKYPMLSGAIADRKAHDIEGTGADCVVAGDLGCLLNIEGRLLRRGARARALHVAEVLAGTAKDGA